MLQQHARKRSLVSRRQLLQYAGAGAVGWTLLETTISGRSLNAQDKDKLAPLNRFPRMVQEYFVSRVRTAEQAVIDAQNQLQTKADAEAYVKGVQERIQQSFGPFPERTPLNPQITGVVDRDTYQIEKLIFESRPGFLVTANVYIPKGQKFPVPGVIGTCGHSTNGKAAEAYQSFAQGLARQGYVCLIYDPISQGERLQYPDEKLKSKISPGVGEHLYAGNQQFLVGEFLGMWRAWDGIRALDYLLTREEVDPKHVGVTGNSGGGTMTTWLCGVERRWTMAAPSCFVTTFRRNMENELPADTEQCPPKALALHLDHADFLAAMAPKPVIILGKEKDFFDARGVEEAYARLKRLYKLLGAEDNISMFIGPSDHGYSQENREAMYQWFNRATGIGHTETEPEIAIEKDETLQCTPNGQVAELKSRPVYEFTRELSGQLARKRQQPQGEEFKQLIRDRLRLPSVPIEIGMAEAKKNAEPNTAIVGVDKDGNLLIGEQKFNDPKDIVAAFKAQAANNDKEGVTIVAHSSSTSGSIQRIISAAAQAGRAIIKLRVHDEYGGVPDYRILRPRSSRSYPTPYSIHYAVETEPGIHAIVCRLTEDRLYSRPPRGPNRAVLYVSHQSSDAELREEPLIKEVIQQEPNAAFFTCDVRGIGDSRPDTTNADSFHAPYGSDYFYAIHSLMLDSPYAGQKTYDLLRVLAWMKSFGHNDIHLVAVGWGAIPATFAAVLFPQVKQVTLKNALTSYQSVAESETYGWPLSSFVPNILAHFDLPDCYRELRSKMLRQIEPWGPEAKPV